MLQWDTIYNGYNGTMSYNGLQYTMSYNGQCHYNKKTQYYNIINHLLQWYGAKYYNANNEQNVGITI